VKRKKHSKDKHKAKAKHKAKDKAAKRRRAASSGSSDEERGKVLPACQLQSCRVCPRAREDGVRPSVLRCLRREAVVCESRPPASLPRTFGCQAYLFFDLQKHKHKAKKRQRASSSSSDSSSDDSQKVIASLRHILCCSGSH